VKTGKFGYLWVILRHESTRTSKTNALGPDQLNDWMNLNTPRILPLPCDKKTGRLPAHCPLCLVPTMDLDDDNDDS